MQNLDVDSWKPTPKGDDRLDFANKRVEYLTEYTPEK